MLRIAVMVSGGGTNLQAIIDGVKDKTITNTQIAAVISNNANAYALTRAKENGIPAYCVSPKDYATRDEFNKALIGTIDSYNLDLIVLAGFLVVLPEEFPPQIRVDPCRNLCTNSSAVFLSSISFSTSSVIMGKLFGTFRIHR